MKSHIIALSLLAVITYQLPSYATTLACARFYKIGATTPYLKQNELIRSVSPDGNAAVEVSKAGIRVVDSSGKDIIPLLDEAALRAMSNAPLPGWGLLTRSEFNWSPDGKMVTVTSPTATYSGSLVLNLEKGTARTELYFTRSFGKDGLVVSPIPYYNRAPEDRSLRAFIRFVRKGPKPELDIRVSDEKGYDRNIILKNAETAQRAVYGNGATTSNSDSFAFSAGPQKFLVESVNKRNTLQIFNMELTLGGDVTATFTKAIDLAKLVQLSDSAEKLQAYSTANGTLEGAIDNVISRNEIISSVDFATSPKSNKIHALVTIKGDWYQYARAAGMHLSTRIVVVEIDPANNTAKVLDQPFKQRQKEGVRWSEPKWPDYTRQQWSTISEATYSSFFIEHTAAGNSEVYGITEHRNENGQTTGYTKTLLSINEMN